MSSRRDVRYICVGVQYTRVARLVDAADTQQQGHEMLLVNLSPRKWCLLVPPVESAGDKQCAGQVGRNDSKTNDESGLDRPGPSVGVVGRKETSPQSVRGSNDDSSRNRTGPRTGMRCGCTT